MAPAESCRIRIARLPDDTPALLDFIRGLQRFEHAFEPKRRIDDGVAVEFFASITERAAKKNGRILIAENAHGRALGWAVTHEDESEVFVRADERINGYIAELYVAEDVRGRGIGRALIAACEDWAREAGFTDCAYLLRKYLR